MNKEEIDLLKVQLLLDYYKNKDIREHYRRLIENNIVFDNDTLDILNDINETIYITKFNKYKELQQENKKYKEVIDKAIEYINKYESIKAYYEYIDEDGYDEYNYDEDFKKELLDILKEVK